MTMPIYGPEPHMEIERKYLLRALPDMPADAEVWRIEQGYMPQARLRAINTSNGTIYIKTVKSGRGLVRTELETELTEAEFRELWPQTAGRRLKKMRHRVRQGQAIW